MHRLILLRHGQSTYNHENRFTGWTDVDLSEDGRNEAKRAARLLKAADFSFDIAFTSRLKRAIRTAWIVEDELNLMSVPLIKEWRLNERHYGALQGLNKNDTMAKFGHDQFEQWRRGYSPRPPALALNDASHPSQDPLYKDIPKDLLPSAESLQDTGKRVWACWQESIAPEIRTGKSAIIVAHGNSLRSLVKQLDSISDEDIEKLDIPTGSPLIYELDDELKPMGHRYLLEGS